jgi:2-polyprenyl-6-methoxyphenol hydroxylase-like FAD-dependent oxidoreductase
MSWQHQDSQQSKLVQVTESETSETTILLKVNVMKVLVVGGGIGGLATALSLHSVGIEAEVFEQTCEIHEIGIGINILPHAVKQLAALGLLPALDRVGIRTRELIYMNRLGQTVWQEPRGMDSGYDTPQFSIHRGKLLGVLHRAALERLGPAHIHADCRLVGFDERAGRAVARFERRGGERFEEAGDALIGADGIHSTVRSTLYPDEGPPAWSGMTIWRGATEWAAYRDGRTMVIAGGNAAKFVFYPIHADPAKPDTRLTNWAIMARTGDAAKPPPRRERWNRVGQLDEVMPFVRDSFRLDFAEPESLIETTGTFYEYPNCGRDPLPRWSSGRVTLLGDAAHPMHPNGSNGASQAILDGRSLASHLTSCTSVVEALAAYDAERRPATAGIVLSNRKGGPEGVIDVVEARAPDGFDDIDKVASYAERKMIVRGYASLAGYATDQVNMRHGPTHAASSFVR